MVGVKRKRTLVVVARTARRNAELKFHDLNTNIVIAAGGVNVPSVNLIPQGVTEITRIGRKCTIKKIIWYYEVGIPKLGSVVNGTVLRVVMYVDRQANGATAAITELFHTASYMSHWNLHNSDRFRILYDEWIDLNLLAVGAGDATQNSAPVWLSKQVSLNVNIPIEFSGTSGAIGEITSNNVGIWVQVKSVLQTEFVGKLRIRFEDGS